MQAVKKLGVWGLFTRGLPLRIVMIGTLTGAQWGIYDAFKVFVGLYVPHSCLLICTCPYKIIMRLCKYIDYNFDLFILLWLTGQLQVESRLLLRLKNEVVFGSMIWNKILESRFLATNHMIIFHLWDGVIIDPFIYIDCRIELIIFGKLG